MYQVLVCDDDKAIVDAARIYLESEGYAVLTAYNGKEAVAVAQKETLHCIILDIMMPVMDGIQATVEIRKSSNVPIIFLSAKSEDTDKITGLSLGADEARVKSQIRRYVAFGSLVEKQGVLTTGGLSIDTEAHQVTVDGEEVHLTATEYKIVEYLMRNMGRTLSSTQIYENVWNENAFASDKTVTVHIRRIREKIEIDSRNPKYLKVVWGIGYKIEKI